MGGTGLAVILVGVVDEKLCLAGDETLLVARIGEMWVRSLRD